MKDQPAPTRIGSYRILGLLGRGGMGVVYRGEDEATGRAVAIKVVSGVSREGIVSIRREIHALGQVAHAGVVRVVDQGTTEGLPWYAMELFEGRTLRALLDEERTRQAPPTDRAIDLCVELCEPLAVVHAAGLVHRDLKPDNVFIAATGRPVLIDFGIAARFGGVLGREVLALAGDVVGTLEYIAPEQLRGELVDARADLYALGVMLYECVAGRTPFADLDAASLIDAHLGAAPVPPSRLGALVSPALEALILRLLEKRPADRIGYAVDVAAALRDLGHGGGPRALPELRVEPYLYRAELTGRGEVMTQARAALHALDAGARGGAIYVGGESGVGKTRLGVEITREASLRRLSVITSQCVPADRQGATPLHPFLPLVSEALARVHEPDGDRDLLEARARVLSPYFPELSALPGFDRLPEPVSLPPAAARRRVLDAAESLLLALAGERPLLLMLDDVHWADELSLSLLQRLDAAKLAERCLLLVCLYRAEEAGDALLGLSGAAGVARWELGRLDERGVAAMAAGMLGAPRVPRAWAAVLARVSSGNPFFAAEYLRAAVEAGILTRNRQGRWTLEAADAPRGEALSLPSTLSALLEARFERLDAGARRLLSAAAILGRSFSGDLVAATAGLGDRAALDALSVLSRRQIVEERADGALGFVHDRLHEVVHARLDAEERRALHASAAVAIEALHGGDPARFAPLGRHHAGAGRHDAAHRCFSLAAAHAASVYANERAIELYRAALEEGGACDAPDAERVEGLRRLGDLLLHVGRAEEAHAAYASALERIDAVGRADLHLVIGKTWEARQRHAEALAAYDEAERSLGDVAAARDVAASWQTRIQIGIERITIHYLAADLEALGQITAALGPLVEEHGTDAQRALFFLSLVMRGLRGARYRTSLETVGHARKSLDAFVRSGDLLQVTSARFNLAAVLLWNDALAEAEREMLTALGEAEAIGHAETMVQCLAYLSMVSRRRRDIDGTRVLSLRCITSAEAAGIAQYVGVGEANLGWAELQEEDGEPEEAERLCRAALARWSALPLAYPFQWLARLPLCRLALDADRIDEAAEHARATLVETQQRLPAALEAAFAGDLPDALRVAESFGFL